MILGVKFSSLESLQNIFNYSYAPYFPYLLKKLV